MARYGKKAEETIAEDMHRFKRGTLKSGKSGRKVKSRKQAIAIAISQAREKGQKVPTRAQSAARKRKSARRGRAATSRSTGTSGRTTAGRKRATSRKSARSRTTRSRSTRGRTGRRTSRAM